MNGKLYWKNRLPFLLTNLVCMIALTVFLFVIGNSLSAVLLILIAWIVIVSVGLGFTYWKRKRQMQRLLDMTGQLSERYLISEVMELPEQAEDQVYYRILKMAGKSMLEQISEVKRERLEYREYIEQWIHEIKTPITAMKLLCENHRTDWTKELLLELEKTTRFTEQALYYARSEHTEKDYSVREMALSNVVHQAIADNKYLLLQNGIHLEVEEMQDTVYSDEKWVRFILNQLIANAVKYRSEQPVLHFPPAGSRIRWSLWWRTMGLEFPPLTCRVFSKRDLPGRMGALFSNQLELACTCANGSVKSWVSAL